MHNDTTGAMHKLIAELRSLMPKRPMTYGLLLQATRLQAWKLRQLRAAADELDINLAWLLNQQAVPVNRVPSYQLSDESGLTTDAISGQLEMYVNANEPLVRQRFTLLHEFKHALDFADADVLYARLGSGNAKRQKQQIEKLANEFAGCVLMPTMLVKRTWFVVQDIDELSRLFNVSPEAATTRLEKLGLIGKPDVEPRMYFRRVGVLPELETAHCDELPECVTAVAA